MIGVVTAGACFADEFILRGKNSGPIKVTTTLTLNDKSRPSLHVEVANQTGLPIQSLKLCVKSPSYKKGCLFQVWTTTPNDLGVSDTMTRDISSNVKIPNVIHEVAVESIEQFVAPLPRPPSKFDPIRKIYVDEFGGNSGPVLRDQIIAVLVNSGRFVAVEKPDLADAIIRGRSDSLDQATKVTSARNGSAGAVFGTVISRGKSTSVTQTVVSETVSLRLTVPSGEAIWAWDGTKPCTQTKAKCAIQDLMAVANQ